MTPEVDAALRHVEQRAEARIAQDSARLAAVLRDIDIHQAVDGLLRAARLTINFHPDRRSPDGTVVSGLLRTGRYLSQFTTGISNGSRSAIVGGARSAFEAAMFADVYDHSPDQRPVYGTLDLLNDTRGGSPGFGSCHLVLDPAITHRCTFTVGDSYLSPPDAGTATAPTSILAGLAEQAATSDLLGRSLGVDAFRSLLAGISRPTATDRLLERYVEAQIHGGVDLSSDVIAVVADPAFRDRETGRQLQELADLAGAELRWHAGNVLAADRFPTDFRRPDLPMMAKEVARPDGLVDAAVIGDRARTIRPGPPTIDGDQSDHPLQWVKHLWQALVVFGDDAD